MRRVKAYRDGDEERVKQAMDLLRLARDLLKEANCPKTAFRVRLSLTSAQGALRNVSYRRFHQDYPQVFPHNGGQP